MLDRVVEIDEQILLWIQENIRTDIFSPIMKGFTYIGNGGAIMIFACFILIIVPKTRKLGILGACALAANVLVNNLVIKNLVGRTRPYEVIEGLKLMIRKQSDYSFPSGHSSAAFALASVIYIETPRKIGIPSMILATVIALSRLYVGVHYPTDVIGGMITGTLLGCLTCYIFHKKIKSKKRLFRQPKTEQ
ncbi:MAG: phosphatase PAP2 family protein [Ruminococcus sp.]|nr:phosphatase PAP2 family protein [Ruminococcus sp.]